MEDFLLTQKMGVFCWCPIPLLSPVFPWKTAPESCQQLRTFFSRGRRRRRRRMSCKGKIPLCLPCTNWTFSVHRSSSLDQPIFKYFTLVKKLAFCVSAWSRGRSCWPERAQRTWFPWRGWLNLQLECSSGREKMFPQNLARPLQLPPVLVCFMVPWERGDYSGRDVLGQPDITASIDFPPLKKKSIYVSSLPSKVKLLHASGGQEERLRHFLKFSASRGVICHCHHHCHFLITPQRLERPMEGPPTVSW